MFGIVPRWLVVLVVVIVGVFVLGVIAHALGGFALNFRYLHFSVG